MSLCFTGQAIEFPLRPVLIYRRLCRTGGAMFEIILPAFFISLILIGIHSYLGLHILARGVIFVDLSLAQMAACGAVFAALAGLPLHSCGAYIVSLSFTLLGAVIFSFSRSRRNIEIPQEAVIGIVYVVSASAGILALDRLPSHAEHLKEMLVGNILFVSWGQVAKTAVLYSFIGLLHYLFREKFTMISFEPDKAAGMKNLKLWDFLFYALFGVVVTSSVELAGVFLVFAFLIIPAVMALLAVNGLKTRIVFSWAAGVLVMTGGLYLSVLMDTPTGATIVAFFGLSLLLVWLLGLFKHKFSVNKRNT